MDAMVWWRSPVFVGAIVSVISQILALSGLAEDIPSEDLSKIVDGSLQVIALAAAGYAAWKRQRSLIQPLTLTKGNAEAHPATVANAAEPAKDKP